MSRRSCRYGKLKHPHGGRRCRAKPHGKHGKRRRSRRSRGSSPLIIGLGLGVGLIALTQLGSNAVGNAGA